MRPLSDEQLLRFGAEAVQLVPLGLGTYFFFSREHPALLNGNLLPPNNGPLGMTSA